MVAIGVSSALTRRQRTCKVHIILGVSSWCCKEDIGRCLGTVGCYKLHGTSVLQGPLGPEGTRSALKLVHLDQHYMLLRVAKQNNYILTIKI